ncbi:hypothetical protein [Novosphingobium humi]|uniref:hypothetical protein n=1 Tax=Novosphingobium humi TaxID=2282397 RepID=UPI0025B0916A|nr:hypothetical protein [Novosphingobium humi]WJS97862.1 hypothetical protein NYQ05_12035 [Novosphingobium humi]
MIAPAVPAPGVVLWHPARRAYLRAAGLGYTRRLSRAAVMTPAQAEALVRKGDQGLLRPEPAFAPHTFSPPATREPLAGLSDAELLRRAIRGLRGGDGPQAPRWAVAMDTLGLTSAGAVALCRRLNLDPKERMGI